MYKSEHTINKNCPLCFKLTYFSLLFQHAFCGIFGLLNAAGFQIPLYMKFGVNICQVMIY